MAVSARTARRLVGITADRRWEEQANLFRRRGLDVVHGPTMRTIDLAGDAGLRSATQRLIESPPDRFVATTGMGVRAWLGAAEGWGLRDALLASLGSTTVFARGAKATSACRQAGLEVAWRATNESMAEVLDELAAQPGIARERVAVQLFDPDDHPSTHALRVLAAEVVEVPVYRWLLPDDPAAAEELVGAAVARRVAAVTFTSQPALHFLFRIAERVGEDRALRDAFNDGSVMPACIGPVCAEAAAEEGIEAPVWPEPFRLPAMVRMVADALG